MGVRVVDHGTAKVLNELWQDTFIRVGIMGSKAAETKTGGSGLTVAQIASYHEFGLGVHRRSFIRDYVDQNEAINKERMSKIAKTIVRSKAKQPAIKLFRIFAETVLDEILARLEAGIPPALSDATKKQRGDGVPLIDTGQLKSSITYEYFYRGRNVTGGGDGR